MSQQFEALQSFFASKKRNGGITDIQHGELLLRTENAQFRFRRRLSSHWTVRKRFWRSALDSPPHLKDKKRQKKGQVEGG